MFVFVLGHLALGALRRSLSWLGHGARLCGIIRCEVLFLVQKVDCSDIGSSVIEWERDRGRTSGVLRVE